MLNKFSVIYQEEDRGVLGGTTGSSARRSTKRLVDIIDEFGFAVEGNPTYSVTKNGTTITLNIQERTLCISNSNNDDRYVLVSDYAAARNVILGEFQYD